MANDDRMLGERSPREIAAYLRAIGDIEAAERFEKRAGQPQGQGFVAAVLGLDQYAYTAMVVGYIPSGVGDRLSIQNASSIDADLELKNKRLKITLDQFYVQSYPGNGHHKILCEFAGQHQFADETEELKFALTLDARDGQAAAIMGKPIFMGLTVGDDGLNFRGQTVHVCSVLDDLVLDALNSDAFKNGLSLVTTIQPALKPFVGLATNVVKSIVKRPENETVFKFELGFDFNKDNLSARIRRGSFVVVQTKDEDWDWSNFEFIKSTRRIVRRIDATPLKLNYFIIGIDDFAGEAAQPVEAKAARRPALRASK